MPAGLIEIIVKYGYLAIFCLIFLQEFGVSIFPNEILLIYFGYLTHEGHLYFPLVIGFAIAADITGTTLIFFLFYYFNHWLLGHKPKWIKLPYRKIIHLKKRMESGARRWVFAGRLTPFFRGLTSVIAGSLHTSPKQYVTMILFAGILWSGGLIVAGWFISPYWDSFTHQFNYSEKWLYTIPFLMILSGIAYHYLSKRKSYKHSENPKSYYEN